MITRLLFLFLCVWIGKATSGIACDYTVRDIGFVELDGPEYSLVVIGPKRYQAEADSSTRLKRWGISLVTMTADLAKDLPPAIHDQLAKRPQQPWSMWLIDDRRRTFELSSAKSQHELMSIQEFIDLRWNTLAMKRVVGGSVNHFAQVIVMGDEDSRANEIATQAADSLRDLESMLPRPIRLPAQVIRIDPQDRHKERLLCWAIGRDGTSNADSVVVIYGRGRLAGPILSGTKITLPSVIAQLALVGESCECETQRDWLSEKTIPFRWTDEQNRQAASMLGFNPSLESVRVDVRQVIDRGRRSNAGSNGDQIDRIVSGYMEASADTTQPELVAIPPGRSTDRRKESAKVRAKIIQGSGWHFDD